MRPSLTASFSRARALVAWPLLAALLLSGCGAFDSKDEADEPAPLPDVDAEVDLKRSWGRNTGSGYDQAVLLVAAIADDRIYAADSDGDVSAYSLSEGDRLWSVDLELEGPISGAVGAGDGLVLVGTTEAELVALDAADGSIRWQTQASSELLSAPQTNGDIVVAHSLDGKLQAFDAADGSARWVWDSTMPLLVQRFNAAPVVTPEVVVAAFDNGKVSLFSAADGVLQWEQRVAIPQGRSDLDRLVDVDGTPLLRNERIYAASFQGRLVALQANNGRPLWATDASTFHAVAEGFSQVYLTQTNDVVRAFQANDGSLVWENDQLKNRDLTAPQTVGSYVVVGDAEGYLHVLSQVDGRYMGREHIGGELRAQPLAYGDTLYVLADNGTLEALTIRARD